jgi:hypothetical protein
MGIMEIIPVEMLPIRPDPKPKTTTGKVDRPECRVGMVFPTQGRPTVPESHQWYLMTAGRSPRYIL